MAFKTRKPTGKPPWPITLIGGVEKTGKSYSCAVASASSLVGRTFWIGIGEDDPDEYGVLPGARFEIVEHDGTYKEILQAIKDAADQPSSNGKPNLIVVDSISCLWDLLTDEAQAVADVRKFNTGQITMDLWNKAGSRWKRVMDALRAHKGPVLVTSRLELTTVMERGKPTVEKDWKLKAHKSLPFDVGVIVEFTERGKAEITGARSLKHDVPLGQRQIIPNFTVEGMWTSLGFGVPDATADRNHATPTLEAVDPSSVNEPEAPRDWAKEAAALNGDTDGLRALYMDAQATGATPETLAHIKEQATT